MTTRVQFHNVSKQYRLGLTRRSLPHLIVNQLKSSLKNSRHKDKNKEYIWALQSINFNLDEGQSLALVGPNGSGKTTILKLMANITRQTSGQITKSGKLSALIELGAGFHPDLTGRENIYLNGTILGLSKNYIESRFDEIVAFSELDQFIDTPVKRYSSGMAVRLGFAVASCIEPDILLVDEVLAVGDASFQQKCMNRIRSLIENGTSIIFVSHNFYLVRAACNRAIYLKNGVIQCDGGIDEAIAIYEQDLHKERSEKFQSSDLGLKEGRQVSGQQNSEDSKIFKVEVLDKNGMETDPLTSDQPVQVRVHYKAYKRLGKVQMSVFIVRSDGLNCCMKRSFLDNFEIILEEGSGTITVHLEKLQLISGTYFAEAWFLNDSDSLVINPEAGRSDWFSVQGLAMTYDDNSGVFEPIGQWEHRKNVTIS